MNNNVLYGVIFGLLGFSGIVLGMELEMSKDQSKNEYFSLFIKNSKDIYKQINDFKTGNCRNIPGISRY